MNQIFVSNRCFVVSRLVAQVKQHEEAMAQLKARLQKAEGELVTKSDAFARELKFRAEEVGSQDGPSETDSCEG